MSIGSRERDDPEPRRRNGQVWSLIRDKWVRATPEELVRQHYLSALINTYGYEKDQIAEEVEVTGRGSARARADFVIWRTSEDKTRQRTPLIVVECKASTVRIRPEDYAQGENYARLTGARFFVTHNSWETRFWRVNPNAMPKTFEEIENIPHAGASDEEIREIVSRLKVFRGNEFANLLHQCHNVIRDREKKDPAAAFDEIAKILFIKVWVERQLRQKQARRNLFTTETLDQQLSDNPLNDLFRQTKDHYRADQIFSADEQINLKPSTGREIVRLLERYNLSDTGEDIKGIAFERFLGRTFRGEIGQFFTPRTIVEFMVRMIDPKEDERLCDPASGSGGFLIRAFELVRDQILGDVDNKYEKYRQELAERGISEEEKAALLRERYEELQQSIDPQWPGSRMWHLANECIYGTDANERMARTSKMNMMMHGDGHGGIHHHDGFIDTDGILEGQFEIVLTNPPFGSNIDSTDLIESAAISVAPWTATDDERRYGATYKASRNRLEASVGKPLLSLFELPKRHRARKVKSEILFLERCLNLLRPGGRLGIVLPEGILNNPSLGWVREFVEERAFIRGVVSLPQETFKSAGADVKASLVFLQKFEAHERDLYAARTDQARHEVELSKKPVGSTSKEWETQQESAIRQRTRELFDYPVFLYEAKHVGITATGEATSNELYPNDHMPPGVEVTCLEEYRRFVSEHTLSPVLEDEAP